MGWLFRHGEERTCATCGASTRDKKALQGATCPVCLTGWDGTPPTQRQITRTYVVIGKPGRFVSAEEQLRDDLAHMSRAGWRISSQSAAGEIRVFGRAFPRLLVVYERSE